MLALIDFGNQVNSNLELDFTLNNLLFTLFAKLLVFRGAIFLFDENKTHRLATSTGLPASATFEPAKIKDEINSRLDEFADKYKLPDRGELKFNEKTLGYVLLGERADKKSFDENDKLFLNTIYSIAATAIENALNFKRLEESNKKLDAKINQLNSLFDLAKEFTGIFDINNATKIFLFSVIGQFLVSKYAVVSCDKNTGVIESKFDAEKIAEIIYGASACFPEPIITARSETAAAKALAEFGAELVVPMQYKNETRGLIILGKRADGKEYSQSDIEYIYSVGSLGMISFENSRLFNEYLEKQKMEKDLELARKIQRNLLPKKIPALEKFDIAAINISARQVGGDYYDVIKLKDDKTLVVIADVSGKGMQAALLMSNIQAVIKTLSKFDYSLAEATNMLNDLIAENASDGSFITMFWAVLDDKNRTLIFSNAGHNPPLLVRNGEITKLTKGGMILGVMPTMMPYESEELHLNVGDKIVMFTDGITEAMDEDLNEYGDERLENLVLNLKGESAEEIKEEILADVRAHVGAAEQSDDITLVLIKVN
jgi:sigma-B regulation protein RsbU (phosphoserine phosphatase)